MKARPKPLIGALAIVLLATACNAQMTNEPSSAPDLSRPVETDLSTLTRRLADTDPVRRRDAAAELGANGALARGAAPALEAAMTRDPRPSVRIAAARALWQVSGEPDAPVTALRDELARLHARYDELARVGEEGLDDAHFDDLFATLDLIRRAVDALGAVGPAAAPAATELASLLEQQVGRVYEDLVPSITSALGSIGPAAASVLPALRRLGRTAGGREERALIAGAIARIEGRAPAATAPEPPTDPMISVD